MANLIASGTSAADSSDFTVTAGTPTTIHLIDADGGNLPSDAQALLYMKSSGNQYRPVKNGELNAMKPELVLDGPGTYRVSKFASSVAFGVDRE